MKEFQEAAQGFKAGLQDSKTSEQERQSAWERQPLALKLLELALVVAGVVGYAILFAKG